MVRQGATCDRCDMNIGDLRGSGCSSERGVMGEWAVEDEEPRWSFYASSILHDGFETIPE